ncbi:hypothetical protein J6590_065443 [Homalodisca vitripennis]|nr:hypothetical protein J6590_103707 [Homalodisca vitripennis]KAG8320562.1 hypothetical protein J6590_065440 [Homalodisca vitripennis]KAG8320565.1 hypothetical protein J6590_065443 [Homalodisca vitripennis]
MAEGNALHRSAWSRYLPAEDLYHPLLPMTVKFKLMFPCARLWRGQVTVAVTDQTSKPVSYDCEHCDTDVAQHSHQ